MNKTVYIIDNEGHTVYRSTVSLEVNSIDYFTAEIDAAVRNGHLEPGDYFVICPDGTFANFSRIRVEPVEQPKLTWRNIR